MSHPSSHPSTGLLRRAVDEPAAMGDADRAHLADCERCRGELAAAVADRDAAVAALLPAGDGHGHGHGTVPGTVPGTGTEGSVDVDAAWRRLSATLDTADPRVAPLAGPPPRQSRRTRLRRPLVAVAAAAVVAIGTTAAAAAADWLPIFQPEKVTAVTLDVHDVSGMPDLSAYGELTAPDGVEPVTVASAAEAARRSGLDVPAVSRLPRGVTGSPQYAVLDRTTARFTFSAAKAREAARRSGQELPPMPAGVDGSVLEVQVGPGVFQTWTSGAGTPDLAVLRMAAPVASAKGVSLATLRDYLLAQPGLPADAAEQLRRIPLDGSVLPIPVPEQYATTRSTTVAGVEATEVALRDGSAAGVVWIKDGRLTAVVGTVDVDDVTDVARGLR
jgi:hypothetical protein